MAIGYACITIGTQNTKLSRCILKNATEDNIRKVIELNLSALEAMVDYNIKLGIKLFRISSDIIPFGSHPINKLQWRLEYKDTFTRIGKKIIDGNMRVSMHPGQYTVLNSPETRVVEKAIEDLEYHAVFLDALGVTTENKIILHIGGVYGNKEKSSAVFIQNYSLLPETITRRLIIENDDKSYTVENVLEISQATGAPVVFDNLHNILNPSQQPLPEVQWIKACSWTWKKYDGRQKIHYSQQKEGAIPGAHSDTIYINKFLEFYQSLPDKSIDIMLEVKDKNLSAVKCINVTAAALPIRALTEEWARYKYLTLSRSGRIYTEIRQRLKDTKADNAKDFYLSVEEAMLLPRDLGAEINAALHVWGYFKHICSKAEKNRYEKLLTALKVNLENAEALKRHLLKCSENHDMDYLKNSLYFYI